MRCPPFEVAAVLAVCTLLAACSEPEPGGGAPAAAATELACADGLDDDGDGRIDCADVDCTPDLACVPFEECSNGADDDFDGKVDCDDPDCGLSCRDVETVCDDWRDDDFDGLADCGDPDCAGAAACGGAELSCADGLDDDRDGQADCEDADCEADPACGVPVVELCDNGLDDDEDGLTDCGDPACSGDDACRGELCDNGQDDDRDGAQDCDDHDCGPADGCTPELCGNRSDDDGDGLFDCNDPYCDGDPACGAGAEDCGNGVDDDGDGAVDCGDAGCAADPRCGASEDCGNLRDDDGDGLSDCLDPDCAGVAGCSGESCSNGRDDDGDSLADCADPDCRAAAGCQESNCANGLDDEGDGSIDCSDVDCGGTAGCAGTEQCGDGRDNNGDGAADCADLGCAHDFTCPPGAGATGAPCTAHTGCAGAVCVTEVQVGWPGGSCTAYCLLDGSLLCNGNDVCVDWGLENQLGLCSPPCGSDGDCRPGYACDLQGSRACVFTGSSGIGDPCTGPGDCAGSCLDEGSSGWPGGYCSQSCVFGGANNGGCPASADCHEASAGALCFQRCAGDADCRSGYSCDAQYAVCVFLPVGGAPIGGGCTVPADCITGACLPEALSGWPGGYCSADCSGAVCPAGSSCLATTGGDLCLDDCSRNGDCRGGYVCDALSAVCVYPG